MDSVLLQLQQGQGREAPQQESNTTFVQYLSEPKLRVFSMLKVVMQVQLLPGACASVV